MPGLPKSLISVGRGAGAAGAGLLGSTVLFTRSLRGLGTGGCSAFVFLTKTAGLTAGIAGRFSLVPWPTSAETSMITLFGIVSFCGMVGATVATAVSLVGEVKESREAWFLALGLGTGT